MLERGIANHSRNRMINVFALYLFWDGLAMGTKKATAE